MSFFKQADDRHAQEDQQGGIGSASKDRTIIIVALAFVVLAVAFGYFLHLFLAPRKISVYIFNDNYRAGTVISSDMLVPVTVDAKLAVAGGNAETTAYFVTAQNYQELINNKENSLRVDVAKGVPLMQSMLSVDGGSYIEMTMNSTMVAVTVPVTSISGVTNDLAPGSRVNIYASKVNDQNKEAETRLIFENMRVLSVQKDDDGLIQGATIECLPGGEDKRLIEAAEAYSIYFGLVNGSGYQSGGTDLEGKGAEAQEAPQEAQEQEGPSEEEGGEEE